MKIVFQEAMKNDLETLVEMLWDDALGSKREDRRRPLNSRYIEAFHHITQSKHNELIVIKYENQIVGMFQLTFIPYLTHVGSWRCLIEGVRIHADYRGQGLGEKAIKWAIERAREKGCNIIQLTSDKQRVHAIRFYEKLGFMATHEGFKLKL